MKILGIHDGHTATACYLQDGVIKTAISEERLTRVKGQGGFPQKAVRHILDSERLNIDDIDHVALVGRIRPLHSTEEYKSGRQNYFPKIIKLYPGDPRKIIKFAVNRGTRRRLQDPVLCDRFAACGVPLEKVRLIEHHQSHAATAYYFSSFHQQHKPALIITLDGSGDGLAGTVSSVNEQGRWTRLHNVSTFDSLGMVYSRVTQYLAMKPWEHEFKLMGMAPYASPEHAEKVFAILHSYLTSTADGLSFNNLQKLWGNSFRDSLDAAFKGHRFDAVAAGVQLLHERLLIPFVVNWVRKTGIKNVAVAGGCFMNIKANKLLMEQEELADLFVMPSCGDESCAIGAALWQYSQEATPERVVIPPLQNLYWGQEFTDLAIEEELKKFKGRITWKRSDDIERESAALLADHKIIGRLSGRMEWGSRALGNRSILANASRLQTIRRLNAAIKMRDFWMPFAPSIRWERRLDYAKIPKDIDAFHMVMGFDSTPLAQEHLIAALHPYDFSMRPQFVKKEHNPSYYDLLTAYEQMTGMGGLLNTSFNLHGWPIVCAPKEAIETLIGSGLDYITINDYIIKRY